MTSIELVEMVIYVSTTDVATVLLVEDIHLSICETTGKDTKFGVSKINKKNVSSISSIKIGLSKHTIIQSYSCRLINQPSNSQLSNFSSIQNSFSLKLSEKGRNSDDCTLIIEVILLNDEF